MIFWTQQKILPSPHLDGEDDDPPRGEHVEEKGHGVVLVGGVGVEDAGGHHCTRRLVENQHVDAPAHGTATAALHYLPWQRGTASEICCTS